MINNLTCPEDHNKTHCGAQNIQINIAKDPKHQTEGPMEIDETKSDHLYVVPRIEVNCPEEEDETYCGSQHIQINIVEDLKDHTEHHDKINTSEMIPIYYTCDGYAHCSLADDEYSCKHTCHNSSQYEDFITLCNVKIVIASQ